MSKIAIKFLALILICNFSNVFCETFIFCPGYDGIKYKGIIGDYNAYKRSAWSILPGNTIAFSFPEIGYNYEEYEFIFNTQIVKFFDISKVNFGQEADIAALKKVVDDVLEKSPKEELVLVGFSRGASTVINYASIYPHNIKALILEAPFDDVLNTCLITPFNLRWIPGFKKIVGFFASLDFPEYKKNGITPIKSIKNLKKDLPVLFVHSKADQIIPDSCSKNLFKELKNLGHSNVYYLGLDGGRHDACLFAEDDPVKFEAGVHAFYKKYGINHDEQLAKSGEKLIEL